MYETLSITTDLSGKLWIEYRKIIWHVNEKPYGIQGEGEKVFQHRKDKGVHKSSSKPKRFQLYFYEAKTSSVTDTYLVR